MKEFRITMAHRAGELARVASALAREEVNIKALAATAGAKQVVLHLVGHDVEATRRGLSSANIPFQEQEVMIVLLEDKAGEVARLASQLSDAGVNLDAIYLAGRADNLVEVVLAVDDVKKAKKVLGE